MRVLIACEFSGIVQNDFASRGHEAMSCDLVPTESSRWHYEGDVRDVLDDGWDLMLAFPPCTYLCSSGARWWRARQSEQAKALNFIRLLLDAPIPKIALENPVGCISTRIRPPDQIIHPWQFGHGERKATCLWLKNLPPLRPTRIVAGRVPRIHLMPDTPTRGKERSRTYPGISEAMANQWGSSQ